jgi:hypothetical protein
MNATIVNTLRRNPRGDTRPCVHAVSGNVTATKLCLFDYQCSHCPYDQWLEDYDRTSRNGGPGLTNVRQ